MNAVDYDNIACMCQRADGCHDVCFTAPSFLPGTSLQFKRVATCVQQLLSQKLATIFVQWSCYTAILGC